MDNMTIYDAVRSVPQEAIKPISAGRLKGMSDINPMWRLKRLTEVFGACGFGWKYEITRQWLETGEDNEIKGFCNINLYVKVDGEWSEAIPGTGGSSLTTVERNGTYVSDEVYKMALTDALSVACKALGMAADVYYANDRTKYTAPAPADKEYKCCDCGKSFTDYTSKDGRKFNAGQMYHMAEGANTDGKARCKECAVKAGTRKEKANG